MKQKSKGSSKPSVELPAKSDTNQTRKVGMVKKSSDFDRNDKISPFTQMASNPCGGGYGKGK